MVQAMNQLKNIYVYISINRAQESWKYKLSMIYNYLISRVIRSPKIEKNSIVQYLKKHLELPLMVTNAYKL